LPSFFPSERCRFKTEFPDEPKSLLQTLGGNSPSACPLATFGNIDAGRHGEFLRSPRPPIRPLMADRRKLGKAKAAGRRTSHPSAVPACCVCERIGQQILPGFSKNYGTAAAGLLEAEIVTADGAVRIANANANPDLFWGIKGGGGGSLGVVTKVTLRTRELPAFFGGVFATIKAASDAAFRRLIDQFMSFYGDSLFNPHSHAEMASNELCLWTLIISPKIFCLFNA
jgi:hypothetical protein